ncbi:hypothetical protein Y032_0011g1531 [Ancylostoma ceylanicum]|uniref:Uncharacterized protein n=1 Tax=Ancylostoma ceylanicum TaxID=53326 RepID=A0A016VF91_9BILA|nr:hypothetical protein Y032_0011g1531 [Ancylostoma ceylanicum]
MRLLITIYWIQLMSSSVHATKDSLSRTTATDDSRARRSQILASRTFHAKGVGGVALDAHICTTDTYFKVTTGGGIYTNAIKVMSWRFTSTYRE